MKLVFLVILTFLICISGCTITPVFESVDEAGKLDALIEDVIAESPDAYLLALDDQLKQELDEVINPSWSEIRKFRMLRYHLFDEEARDVTYKPDATLTAAETYRAGHGNCLAISNLFIASARYLGMDARYQTVWVRPTWEGTDGTMIRYEHIVAIGKLKTGDEYVVDFLPEFSVSDRGKEVINDVQALALFHNNLGAEAVVRREHEKAIEELLHAAKLWPENSDTWNNLGAAFRRLGRNELAEASYKRALRLDKNNYSALANLTQYYLAMNRREEAEQFLSRVTRYYRRNPYYYYYMAQLFFRNRQYDESLVNLEHAIRLKKDDPDFYRALSELHLRLGNEREAKLNAQLAETVSPRAARVGRERTGSVRTFRISR